jgi:heterodisulfide reductase subunit A
VAFPPRIGVYICHCGINIAATVDVTTLAEAVAHLPGVVVSRHYTYMCSDPGQALIQNDIASLHLNRIVVASCSPRMHEPTFRNAIVAAGLNPYCLDMANIREQCSWVHADLTTGTLKAIDLVSAAVARAARLQPLEVRQVSVTPAALVVGGGIAGLQAAHNIAQAGFEVTLIERAAYLGGHMTELNSTFPTLEPASQLILPLIDGVLNHPLIHVLMEANLVELDGYVGNFVAVVRQGETEFQVPVGTIVVATGYEIFDARRRPELGYGVYPQVITSLDFERMVSQKNGFDQFKSVVFIQCVGSRDRSLGNPYCSRACCMVTARQALQVCQRQPEARVTVFYMDVRAFGKGHEAFYDKARESGVIYRRGNPAELIRRGERVVVRAEDTLLGELIEEEADLVVLSVGMTPRSDTGVVAGLLKLPRSADGFFLEAHPKMRPVDTAIAGIFLAGCCQSPKDITDTISQARAAASAAIIPLMRGQVPVEAATSYIVEELCAGCGQCAQVCAYGALKIHPLRGIMTVNPVLCQGCGACAATCPSGAINVHHYTFEQFMSQIDALVYPGLIIPQYEQAGSP